MHFAFVWPGIEDTTALPVASLPAEGFHCRAGGFLPLLPGVCFERPIV